MFLPILLCLLITASPLGYVVYRAYKLAELERIARSWDGMRLGRLAESIDPYQPLLPVDDDPLGLRQIDRNRSATFPQFDEATQSGLDALSQAIAASKVSLVPQIEHTFFSDGQGPELLRDIITKRQDDAVGEFWIAYLEDTPEIVGGGETEYEAFLSVKKKIERLPQPDYEEIQAVYPEWK